MVTIKSPRQGRRVGVAESRARDLSNGSPTGSRSKAPEVRGQNPGNGVWGGAPGNYEYYTYMTKIVHHITECCLQC